MGGFGFVAVEEGVGEEFEVVLVVLGDDDGTGSGVVVATFTVG